MKTEYQTVTLPIDDKLQDALAALQAEGWRIADGTVPVTVYHLQREAAAGLGGMAIRDDLVTVIKQ